LTFGFNRFIDLVSLLLMEKRVWMRMTWKVFLPLFLLANAFLMNISFFLQRV